MLKSDLVDIMLATRNGTLADTEVQFSDGAACCVIMASNGYPQSYEKGFEITQTAPLPEGAQLFYAGAKKDGEHLLTSGGRVLGATAAAKDLHSAVLMAYNTIGCVHFDNAYYRKDIGKRALDAIIKE